MQKLDDEAAAKFITALSKSVQTLCHGFLDFHNGIEIIGYIHLNVDKGSNLHYVLEEKVCKNEENSTLFISNSFQAQNQKQDPKGKGKDSENAPSGKTVVQRSNSTDSGETGKVSSAISSISSALSRSHEKSRTASTSSTKETDTLHSRPVSSTAKRKASDDLNADVRSAKSSHLSSSPSPVSHFLTHSSPHEQVRRTSPIDAKPVLSELRNEDTSGTVLPQTANIAGDSVGDIGVNLAGSVLERVDDHSNSDLPDRGDDSDGDLEVTFIKEEYVEGEQSSCQFENSSGQQQHYGRTSHQRASSSENMPDASLYPVSIHPSASATYVPSAQDIAAAAQHYGPSTSSQPQPGTSGVRGRALSGATCTTDLTSDLDLDLNYPAYLARHSPGGATSPRSRTEPGPRPRAPRRTQPGTPSGHLPCDQCGATFATTRGLKLHRDFSHFNKAPYSCPICGRGFTMRGHYVGHMNMHNKVKAFKCLKCPKAFAHRSSLRYHLRNSDCGK